MTAKFDKRNLFASVFSLLTIISMTLFFNLYDPWQPVGPQLIQDGGFNRLSCTNEWSGWQENTDWAADGGFNGSPGVVLTTSEKKHGRLRMTIEHPERFPAFRVSVRATASNVRQGKKSWDVPRGIFFFRNQAGKTVQGKYYSVFGIEKDTGWRRYSEVFPVPDDVLDARLQFQNFAGSGTLHLDDVSVIPVRPRPSAAGLSIFFLLLWSAAFGIAMLTLHPWTRRGGWLIVLTSLAIVVGTATPGKILDGSITETARWVKGLVPTPEKPAVVPAAAVQKAKPAGKPVQNPAQKPALPKDDEIVNTVHFQGHLLLFILLALLCAYGWPGCLFRTAGGLLLFACSTEVLQFVSIDRAAGISDLIVDLTGAGAGLLAATAIRRLLLLWK
ncbi:MAG: VanZ family protein [Kiritimatiellales bacterium]